MMNRRIGILGGLVTLGLAVASLPPASAQDRLSKINHVIVIYQENHSFDNYFGDFPGADGIANAGAAATQVDKDGNLYPTLPHPLANPVDGQRLPDPRFPDDLPNGPFLFNAF